MTSADAAKPLQGSLALITGATGGIGRATCLCLARLGCDIAAHYNADADGAAVLVTELRGIGVKAEAFQANLGVDEELVSLHARATQSFAPQHITILFANAGTTAAHAGITADILAVPPAAFEEAWRVNTLAPFRLTQLVVPGMLAAGAGRVVYCSSVAAFTGGAVGPHYASSKAALGGLVHWGSAAYAARGITFNAVAPALVGDTKMLNSIGSNEALAQKIPVRRLGRPEEVAETVAWMCRVGYVTNKVIGVDGGMFPQ